MRALIGHPFLLRGLLVRAGIVWLGIRVLALASRQDVDGAASSIAIGLFATAIVVIDAKVTRELFFLRNLGLSWPWLAGLSMAAALTLELARALIL